MKKQNTIKNHSNAALMLGAIILCTLAVLGLSQIYSVDFIGTSESTLMVACLLYFVVIYIQWRIVSQSELSSTSKAKPDAKPRPSNTPPVRPGLRLKLVAMCLISTTYMYFLSLAYKAIIYNGNNIPSATNLFGLFDDNMWDFIVYILALATSMIVLAVTHKHSRSISSHTK